jgi:hypothetical protein
MRTENQKGRERFWRCGLLNFNPGGDLRSRVVSSAVSSARQGLTSVFGMGTGVTLAVRPPGNLCIEIGILRFGLGRERREPKDKIRDFDEQLKEVGNRKFRTISSQCEKCVFPPRLVRGDGLGKFYG